MDKIDAALDVFNLVKNSDQYFVFVLDENRYAYKIQVDIDHLASAMAASISKEPELERLFFLIQNIINSESVLNRENGIG